MGSWGEGPFENDAAQDWILEIEGGGIHSVRSALAATAVAHPDEWLDVDEGSVAVAAAATVAGALGVGRDAIPPAVVRWLDANPGTVERDDAARAQAAVARVLAPNSELRSLWDAHGRDSAWHRAVRDLQAQLLTLSSLPVPENGVASGAEADRMKTVLLTFLQARGLVPDASQRARIWSCDDRDAVRSWLGRALHAPSVAWVLDGDD